MFNIVWSSVIFFSGKILTRSKANTDFGRAQIIPRHIRITQSITEALVLLLLLSLHHSTHKSNIAGMRMLWFPAFRSFPQKFGYLQWPWQKTSLIASLPPIPVLHKPSSHTAQQSITICSNICLLIWCTIYLIDPFYAAPRLAVHYSGRVNSTHCFFS